MKLKQNHLEILRKLNEKTVYTQRELAKELSFSLGKLNYLYILTSKGFKEKTLLTINFIKRKLNEYKQLIKELKNFRKDVDKN